jgi:hypothetical protein
MNRVYHVHEKGSCTYYYPVGGENRTKAIMAYLDEIGENQGDFIHYRAKLAYDRKGRPIYTENTGFLDMEELMPKGYKTWWSCDMCGAEKHFEYLPIDRYKCKCGYEADIPFVD